MKFDGVSRDCDGNIQVTINLGVKNMDDVNLDCPMERPGNPATYHHAPKDDYCEFTDDYCPYHFISHKDKKCPIQSALDRIEELNSRNDVVQ